MDFDLERLNPPQREAVLHGQDPLLVLAGAGTGKTTVITYRIAHFLHDGVKPWRILAVTFTNKAAREMRERSEKLAASVQTKDVPPGKLTIGTFHGVCGRLLRQYGEQLGLDRSFIIYDSDDQLSLVKRCIADLDLDLAPKAVRHHIERWKNQGLVPSEVTPADSSAFNAHKVYVLYEKRLIEQNSVDFGGMLLNTYRLLRTSEEVRDKVRARWSHLLVDEYQDTNRVQYEILRQLYTPEHSLTVVGDDDQSIYRWRGADIANILRFDTDYAAAQVVRLEQNYRSTSTILAAANAVISNNAARRGKNLFTTGDAGCDIGLRQFNTEREEGEALGDSIAEAIQNGTDIHDIAVLYRTNAQSRPVEDALRRRRINYAVYGGLRFYARKEVRDALAFLRIINNPRADIDFTRIINVPSRGIGKTTIERVSRYSATHGLSMLAASKAAADGAVKLSAKPRKALGDFADLIEEYQRFSKQAPPDEVLKGVLEDTGYLEMYRTEGTPEAGDRLDNVGELIEALREYSETAAEPTLADFLEEAALAGDTDEMPQEGGKVSLMTLHSAKGLEFDLVFMPGLEEGIFPHRRSANERQELEEERRLCYVGITRAKTQLHLSAARRRFTFGEATYSDLSRFVHEIPEELLAFGNPEEQYEREGSDPSIIYDTSLAEPAPYELPSSYDDGSAGDGGFEAGMRVTHASFGEGEVMEVYHERGKLMVRVSFPGYEHPKAVVAKYVQMSG